MNSTALVIELTIRTPQSVHGNGSGLTGETSTPVGSWSGGPI
ncbi:MAG: hypothetical protein QOF58_848 [Pseudonocardiales bacterium]|jgi:hypothetical protein|nr:hypothetical protein [Pseudonocardiales bacterium]